MGLNWPIYFKDKLIVGNLKSSLAIATLWTPKEFVAQAVGLDKVCVIGQLYTKRGINYLIRNILANPFITKIILVGSDLMGSGEALLDLSRGRNMREIIDLDGFIPIKEVVKFNKNVEIINVGGDLKGLKSVVEKEYSSASFWARPKIFSDLGANLRGARPSEFTSITIRRGLISEVWVEVLKHLLAFGEDSKMISQYGNSTKELMNLTAVVEGEDPYNPVLPGFFGFNESDLKKYFRGFFDPKRGREAYTYGERLFNYGEDKKLDQMDVMFKKLKSFSRDKGALAVLWNPLIDNFPIRDPWRTPCLVLIQTLIYSKKLYLTAYFRSNDMFGAWPLNAFALRKLQYDLAKRLNLGAGDLTTISGSAQLYDTNFKEAEKIVDKNSRYFCRFDLRGNFIVSVEGKYIVVKHQTPTGIDIKEYKVDGTKPKSAMNLCNEIIKDLGISDLGNAADLGRQVARAEAAVQLNLKFVQDHSLSR